MDNVSDATEVKIPLILIGAALVLFAVYGFVLAGAQGATFTVIGLLVLVAIQIPLGLVALFVTAKIMSISFGPLGTAVLKLAAIFLFPTAVEILIPGTAIAWIVSVLLYLGLLAWLFDLEGWEVLACAIVIWLVRFVAGILVAMALAGG